MWGRGVCGIVLSRVSMGRRREDFRTYEVGDVYGVSGWNIIRMDWETVGQGMVFMAGNGRRVKFWKDRWCQEKPLRVAFSTL